MKKNIVKILVLVLVVIGLTGCVEDPSKIKDIKKVAVVTVSADVWTDASAYNVDVFKNRLEGDLYLDYNQNSYKAVVASLNVAFRESTSNIKIVTIDKFKDNPIYVNNSSEREGSKKRVMFEGYRDFYVNNQDAVKALCKELDVDALVWINLNYGLEETGKPMFALEDYFRVFIYYDFKMVNKKGESIYNRSWYIRSNLRGIGRYVGSNKPIIRGRDYADLPELAVKELMKFYSGIPK